jgi:MYXO-CTERM domain-containing protein
MDPTSSAGELKILTQMDITAFDVIGWNLNNTVATPAPASALVFVFGLAGLAMARRRNARA